MTRRPSTARGDTQNVRTPAVEPLAYSLEDAGKALGGISVKTLHRWEREGKLTMTRLGRRTVVRRAELERVLEEGEKRAA